MKLEQKAFLLLIGYVVVSIMLIVLASSPSSGIATMILSLFGIEEKELRSYTKIYFFVTITIIAISIAYLAKTKKISRTPEKYFPYLDTFGSKIVTNEKRFLLLTSLFVITLIILAVSLLLN